MGAGTIPLLEALTVWRDEISEKEVEYEYGDRKTWPKEHPPYFGYPKE